MLVASQPFLTEADSRAAIRGSRDPLAIIPIWSQFGRHVVGNLTTVTNSVRGFTTLLIGIYLANEIQGSAQGQMLRRSSIYSSSSNSSQPTPVTTSIATKISAVFAAFSTGCLSDPPRLCVQSSASRSFRIRRYTGSGSVHNGGPGEWFHSA